MRLMYCRAVSQRVNGVLGVLGVLQAGFFLTGRSRLFAACDCGARTARDRRCRAAMHLIWRKTRLRRDFRWQACG
jgi:hypothetical protein